MSEAAERMLLTTSRAGLRVAVLLPCYNEQEAIGQVVRDFRQALPEAIVYVYDNNSQVETRARAAAAGAVVRSESQQGKGFVVRRMFADVEADVYVLVDGDDTYHAPSAPLLVERLLADQLDMVVGRRVTEIEQAYRPGHRLGNRLLTGVVARVFGDRFKDILSGYRVFSRRFVKSFPALTKEFEIETELTVHALELDMPIAEVDTPYKDRPAGSASKLRTYRDGVRILTTILVLFKEERPLAFFGLAGLALALLALGLGYPVLTEYLRTGLVPRFPTAILATGLMTLAFLSFTSGLVLETVTRGRKELKRLAYLTIPGPR